MSNEKFTQGTHMPTRQHGEISVTEYKGIKCTFSYWNEYWYLVDAQEE